MTGPGEIYSAYRDRVMTYLSGKVRSREDAEDLCADVFEQVFRSLPRYDPEKASLNTWIFTIARYTLISYYRRGTAPAADLPEDLCAPDDPEADLIREETLSRLAGILADMDREKRDILVLCYWQGCTLARVSALTGISYGTVKVTHRQALQALRRQLA